MAEIASATAGLSRLSGVAGSAAPPRGEARSPQDDALLGAFEGVLRDAATSLQASETASVAGLEGQLSIDRVVHAVMSAEQQLQTAVVLRDKIVAAYLEISRMPI